MLDQKRFDGTVAVFFDGPGWGFLSIGQDSDSRLFFHVRDVRPDWRGSTSWVKVVGTPVTFTKKINSSRKFPGQKLPAAADVAPVFVDDSAIENLATYREVSRVRAWNGRFGELLRDCGSTLFFHRSSVIQGSAADVQINDYVYHAVSQREDGRWRASEIQLYSRDEQSRLQQGLPAYEIEAEPDPIAPDATIEILSAANRKKTLLDLVQEKRNAKETNFSD
jgi:hypothetical protein